MSHSVHLYRRILREAASLPGPVKRKVRLNTREVYFVHAREADPARLAQAQEHAAAAARVLAWLNTLPQVGACLLWGVCRPLC